MTNSTSNPGARREDEPADGRTQRNGPTPPVATGQDAPKQAAAGSNASEHGQGESASRIATIPSASGSTHATAGTATKGGERMPADRGTGASRDDATQEALRCLIHGVELFVREVPRGTTARFDGVTEELRKARRALDTRSGGSSATAASGRSEGSKDTSKSPQATPMAVGAASSRGNDSSDEIPTESKATPVSF